MKFMKYVGPGTGPKLENSALSGAYDFSANVIQELTDADAAMLKMRCGGSFKEVADPGLASYVVTRTADSTVPVIASAVVLDKTLILSYTEAGSTLNASEFPDPADFAVLTNSVANAVKTVRVVGKTVVLGLTNGVGTYTSTVSYTQQGTGVKQIKDLKGNKAANLIAQAITNLTADVTLPALSTAVINGANLVLTYTEANALSAVKVADKADFVVKVAGTSRTLKSALTNGPAKTVTLVLSTPVTSGQVVTVSYTQKTDGTGTIQDTAGNKAVNLTNQAVTNSTP